MDFVPPLLPEGFRTVPNCKKMQERLQSSFSYVDILFANGDSTDYTCARGWRWSVGQKLRDRRAYEIYAYRLCEPDKPL